MNSNSEGSEFTALYTQAAERLIAARNLSPDDQSRQFFDGLVNVLLAFIRAKSGLEGLVNPGEN